MLGLCAAIYLDLGIGYDRNIDEGRNPQSVISATCMLDNNWGLNYTHNSSVFNGFPFNHKQEDLVNQFSVVYRFKIK